MNNMSLLYAERDAMQRRAESAEANWMELRDALVAWGKVAGQVGSSPGRLRLPWPPAFVALKTIADRLLKEDDVRGARPRKPKKKPQKKGAR